MNGWGWLFMSCSLAVGLGRNHLSLLAIALGATRGFKRSVLSALRNVPQDLLSLGRITGISRDHRNFALRAA